MKKGFSLIELLLVFAIISILSGFSILGAQQLLANRAHKNTLHLLKTSLYSAQSNSQNTGFTSVTCPSTDSKNCNSNSDWSNGWITYLDVDDNKELDPGETITLARWITDDKLTIKFNAADRGKKIVFYSNGRLWPNGNFVVCHQAIATKYKITTSLSGRIRIEESEEFSCD